MVIFVKNNNEIEKLKEALYNIGLINDLSKNRFLMKCPFHNEVNGNSFYLNLDKHYFKCFGKCSIEYETDLNKLINQLNLTNISFNKSKRSFKDEINNGRSIINLDSVKIKSKKIKKQYDPTTFQASKLDWLNKLPFDEWYLPNKRYLKPELVVKNNIRYSHYHRRIYMPYYYNRTLYGYVSRTTLENTNLFAKLVQSTQKAYLDKYFNVDFDYNNTDHVNWLYNLFIRESNQYLNDLFLDKFKKYKPHLKFQNSYQLAREFFFYEPLTNSEIESEYIFIVESIIDAISLNQLNIKSLALLGGFISDAHLDLLKTRSEQIVLMFDSDQAGKKFVKQFNKAFGLTKTLKFDRTLLPFSVKDANDLLKLDKNDYFSKLLKDENNYKILL